MDREIIEANPGEWLPTFCKRLCHLADKRGEVVFGVHNDREIFAYPGQDFSEVEELWDAQRLAGA